MKYAHSGTMLNALPYVKDFSLSYAVTFKVAIVLIGTILLVLSAKLSIPMYPVPMTIQSLVVLGLGMIYGYKLAIVTMAAYLVTGLTGLPVFAGTPEKGIGLAYMMGPTGGYLVGFIFAAGFCGFCADRGWDRNFLSTVAVMILGNVVIYAFGVLWLAVLFGFDQPLFAWGVFPFILGDVVKVLIAAIVFPLAWKKLNAAKQK